MRALIIAIALLIFGPVPTLAAKEVNTITLSRGDTAYVDRGEGDAVILIHGLGADMSRWDANIEGLSAGHRVIALDLYGFGASGRLEHGYRAEVFVDQIEEFRQALGLGRVSLVGNSMGGWVAMLYAEQFPDHVDRLVLVAPAFYNGVPAEVTAERLAAGAAPQTPEAMRAYLARVYANPPTGKYEVEKLHAEHIAKNAGDAIPSMARSIVAREDTFTPERAAALSAPTLIVHGATDGIIPASASDALASLLEQGELYVYESAGHWPQEEAPERFNKDVALFLSRQ